MTDCVLSIASVIRLTPSIHPTSNAIADLESSRCRIFAAFGDFTDEFLADDWRARQAGIIFVFGNAVFDGRDGFSITGPQLGAVETYGVDADKDEIGVWERRFGIVGLVGETSAWW